MSNIDKRALREAAEKATPGRWEYYPGNTSIEYNVDSMDEDQGSIVYVDSGDFTQKQTDLNGTFIAAANPATVLALLDELEAAEQRNAELVHNHRVHAARLIDERGQLKQRIADQQGIILSARQFISEYAASGDVGADEFVKVIDRAAGIGKGE